MGGQKQYFSGAFHLFHSLRSNFKASNRRLATNGLPSFLNTRNILIEVPMKDLALIKDLGIQFQTDPKS